ncbi:hypothetical protein DEEACLCL_00122 [Salmonella phage CRW-SP2]|nr:hypothetical protein DEEACLCL_00122 [Salmonella phage CRW-SP2]
MVNKMDSKVYSVPIANRAVVLERIEKMQKRAAKLGIPFPTTEIGEPYSRPVRDLMTGKLFYVWKFDVKMSGEGIDRPVSCGGWNIIGQFNHEYPKVILNKLSDDINPFFMRRFEAENVSWCEDCQRVIHRKNTYVIQNAETGAQMLVGGSCMHKYVPNQKSVDGVMSYYLHLHEDLFGENEDGRWESTIKHEDTRWFLKAHFMVLLTGLSIKDDDFGLVVSHVMSLKTPSRDKPRLVRLYSKALSHYEDAESEMYHMDLFIKNLPENNDFNVRLKRMCEPGYHLIKDGTTVRWGAVKYYDYLTRGFNKPVSKPTSWFGKVGDMIDLEVEFQRRVFLYDNEYGSVYLYTFKTKQGHIITWKTSYIEEEFLQGELAIRGRIKDHTEYRGDKQTQITRAKIKKLCLS